MMILIQYMIQTNRSPLRKLKSKLPLPNSKRKRLRKILLSWVVILSDSFSVVSRESLADY